MARQRDEKGRFVEDVPLEEINEFVQEAAPVVTTREVANHFDIPWRTANHKLHKLVEKGTVAKSKFGQTTLWGRRSPPTSSAGEAPTSGGFRQFRGVMDAEKSADELVAEAREEDAKRDERLLRAAGGSGEGSQ